MVKSSTKRVLIIGYSFSGQSSSLLKKMIKGLEQQGIEVNSEKLQPITLVRFPFANIPATISMMLLTFFRKRIPIADLSSTCAENYDLIILAGPTWSYHPSGPVLSLFDRDGTRLFAGQNVIPIISCRGYWRTHWWGLRQKLRRCGAAIPNLIVFTHPTREPWRTIGVFLKLAGKNPEQSKFWGKKYPKYGHSKEQQGEAQRFGDLIGQAMNNDASLAELDFNTPLARP